MKRALPVLFLIGCMDPDDLVPKTVDDDPSLPAIDIADTRVPAPILVDSTEADVIEEAL